MLRYEQVRRQDGLLYKSPPYLVCFISFHVSALVIVSFHGGSHETFSASLNFLLKQLCKNLALYKLLSAEMRSAWRLH